MRAGRDPQCLNRDDIEILAPLDEFHCLAKKATTDLAALVRLQRGMEVLDVGSGVGGPSRRLVVDYGCRVTGLDITRDFHEASVGLAEGMGLGRSQVEYFHGDAVDMPFGGASFDVAWMQTTDINIADRDCLYREIYRVLKPSGRLAVYDLFASPGAPPYYPVPWAYDDTTSFLLSREETARALLNAGLRLVECQDISSRAEAWYRCEVMKHLPPQTPPVMGHHVLLTDWPVMAFNQWRNLKEKRIFFAYLVCERL